MDSPLYELLHQVGDVKIVTPLGDRQPEVEWHVHWFHRSTAEAKLEGACPVFVPPDTIWADGSLGFFAAKLAEGYVGVACPFVLVNADTLLTELPTFETSSSLTIPASNLTQLALQHLHPLHILGMPGAPHARPAFEIHWPDGHERLLSRYAVRELVAFDPNKCPITFLWYAGGGAIHGIYFGDNSNDMLMLSVTPSENISKTIF